MKLSVLSSVQAIEHVKMLRDCIDSIGLVAELHHGRFSFEDINYYSLVFTELKETHVSLPFFQIGTIQIYIPSQSLRKAIKYKKMIICDGEIEFL